MKNLHMISFILLLVGGVNWGLIGIGGFVGANWNVVGLILGGMPALEWLVYVLVGAAAVYEIVTHKARCKECAGGGM